MAAGSEPIDLFHQIFGTDFFKQLAEATNMNVVAKSPPPEDVAHARFATSDGTWCATTAAEMQAYIGVNVAMGFKDLPKYKDYWATDPILHDPFISSVLSRQRYEKLCQYLDCSILANKETGDKLAKIRPLITLCETNFHQCFVPSQNLSIDEAMIQFDGRLAWKQYIKKKGMVLYSAVSSPLDRSKRFTLSSPGRPVHSDTVLGFSWKHSSHAAIAQRLFTHISTTVYSQVLIYTAESTEASWSERKCPNFETVTTGIRTRALSIASPAFYQLSYRAPHAQEAHKVGIKLWCLCDSNTGYCVAFSVYCGTD